MNEFEKEEEGKNIETSENLASLSPDSLLGLWKEFPRERKLLGIDWGETRVGVAVSDRLGIIASPLTTLLRRKGAPFKPVRGVKKQKTPNQGDPDKKLLNDLVLLVHTEAPLLGVCVGIPFNMNGSAGFQAQRVFQFAQKLSQRVPVPVVLSDERLSSMAVERVMLSEDRSRRFRQKHIDQNAAAFVLQGVLDRLNRAIALEAGLDFFS